MKLAFIASETAFAQEAFENLTLLYGNVAPEDADYIVALGGDGLVMKTMHNMLPLGKEIFPIRRTSSVGFLCNNYKTEDLCERIERAHRVHLNPLKVTTTSSKGVEKTALAINEIAVVRDSAQAARLTLTIDGIERMAKFSGDGLLTATPAGSTAYNRSVGGPIMPLDANTLVTTAISGFRPRHWHYAVLPQSAVIEIETLEMDKRPVRMEAELHTFHDVAHTRIQMDKSNTFTLLFDPEEHLSERIIQEQFTT